MLIPRAFLFVTGAGAAADSTGGDLSAGIAGMWFHWDPAHYLRIADVGYRSSGEDALFIVFFPLFPLLVAAAGFLVRNLVVAALIVTTVSSIASGWLLYRLARLDRSEEDSRGAVILLFAFPTAYALFAPFSESVFLMCVLGSIYAARTGRWWLAGLAGLAASATRMVGLALVPALLVEAFVAQRGTTDCLGGTPKSNTTDRLGGTPKNNTTDRLGGTPRSNGSVTQKLAAICLVPLGFVAYLGINLAVHGDAFHFLEVQDEHWFQHAVAPWVPVTDAIEGMKGVEMNVETFLVHPARLVAIGFALSVIALGWRSLRWTDRTFSLATMLMVMSASWLISLPRYLLAIYPLFTTMGRLGRKPWLLWPVALSGLALQLFLFSRFARGMWAF
ncbi:MAG: hypothetical protein M3271_06075 [Actinomycetota bacterium]|nr:hypothetical protein [Actinomycetota bacterium]